MVNNGDEIESQEPVVIWRKYRPPEGVVTLWTNPDMKQCTKCFYTDSDEDVMTAHYIKQHTLEGREITEDDKKLLILSQLPNESVVCVYCLSSQKTRATRFFNADGSLAKNVKCVECKLEMRQATMDLIVKKGAREFGKWAGENKASFWQRIRPDHDGYLDKMRKTFPREWTNLFWDGYKEGNPEFAEKMKTQDAARQYEHSTGFK